MRTTPTSTDQARAAWQAVVNQDPVWLPTLLLAGAVGFGTLGRLAALGEHALCDLAATLTSWLVVPPLTGVAVVAWLLDRRWPAPARRLAATFCLLAGLLAGMAAPAVDRWVEGAQQRRLWALTPRLAPVTHALAAYQRDHGQPPKELRDLVPDYLDSLPGPALLRGAVLRYSGAGRTLVYRLSKGELRVTVVGYHPAVARVTGATDTPVAHFDALAWRRGRPAGQALAFARDFPRNCGFRGLVAMLGQPDLDIGSGATNWCLSLAMPIPSELVLSYQPADGGGASGQEGRWVDGRE